MRRSVEKDMRRLPKEVVNPHPESDIRISRDLFHRASQESLLVRIAHIS